MVEFNWKRFAVSAGAKYLESKIDDDEFWSDLLRKKINPKLKELHGLVLVEYFEKNMPFDQIFGSGDLEKIHNLTEGNEDLLVKLRLKAELSLKSFEWSWIENWFKKDHPILLGVIINHPRSEEFKKYLVFQIGNLSRNITKSF